MACHRLIINYLALAGALSRCFFFVTQTTGLKQKIYVPIFMYISLFFCVCIHESNALVYCGIYYIYI